MQTFDEGADGLTAETSWETIHVTVDEARSSMYLAGSAAIMLLWGVVTSVGYLSMYAVYTLTPGFAEQWPWFPGPLWGGLAMAGSAGSSILGGRGRPAPRLRDRGAPGRDARDVLLDGVDRGGDGSS